MVKALSPSLVLLPSLAAAKGLEGEAIPGQNDVGGRRWTLRHSCSENGWHSPKTLCPLLPITAQKQTLPGLRALAFVSAGENYFSPVKAMGSVSVGRYFSGPGLVLN